MSDQTILLRRRNKEESENKKKLLIFIFRTLQHFRIFFLSIGIFKVFFVGSLK